MRYSTFLPPDHPECKAYSERRAERFRYNRPKPVWGWRDPKGALWFYDPFEASRVIKWIERYCRHKKGEWSGKRLKLAPWQRRIIRELFGFFGADGYRKHREAWIEIPRKNGKSTLAAAIGLYLMIADDEPAAEVYSFAGSFEQASLVYSDARAMIDLEPELSRIIDHHDKGAVHGRSNSFFKPLGKGNQHGLNPSGGIGDEVHEWRGREQYEAMTTATGTRRQPLLLFITTAGADIQSLAGDLHRTALMVRDGLLYRPDLFVAIFAAEPGDDWQSETTWLKANPGMRHGAPKLSTMRANYNKALQSEAEKDSFKRLYLNIWTDGQTGWITGEQWKACERPIDWGLLRGARCYAGLDLAKVRDLSVLSLLFTPDNPVYPGHWLLACRFWCPDDNIVERGRADGIDYKSWRERGLLVSTPGNTTDFDVIERDILKVCETFDVQALGYDPFLAQQLIQHAIEAGVNCVEVRQGVLTLGPPTAELQRKVLSKELYHGGHEIMAWNIANTVVVSDASNNIRPHKAKSEKKIDGAVATINALAVAMSNEGEGSAYNNGQAAVLV